MRESRTRKGVSVDCVFCDIDGFRTESATVVENELALFGNLEQGDALNGSGVIVPKAREVRSLLEDRYDPDGFNIGLPAGEGATSRLRTSSRCLS
jgi:diadenosine tetraphosphate (Ap4A) HIT family hydrolase